jgi:plasmid maintenance system killer protein
MPPGNRLEALQGDLRGFHSIRVNDQWRIVFRWSEGNASDWTSIRPVDTQIHSTRPARPPRTLRG